MKYSIEGGTLPVVICELDSGEKVISESGAMSWMTPNMKMETSGGGLGKCLDVRFPEKICSRTFILLKTDRE